MLRVAEQFDRTDQGRQRTSNEDAKFARPPLFAVADGMGGARAGEVASRMAVEAFDDSRNPEADPEKWVLEEFADATDTEIVWIWSGVLPHLRMSSRL